MSDQSANVETYIKRLLKTGGVPPVIQREAAQIMANQQARIISISTELEAKDKRIAELEERLEVERMRLAACGVVAMANTPESAVKARDMHQDYKSASCEDVAAAVDREMHYRDAFGYQALGWMCAELCALVDKGIDIRKVEVPELIERFKETFAAAKENDDDSPQ